jgi:cell division protein FtsL
MFAKLLVAVVILTGIGGMLLGLRQQRLQMMHEMALLHAQLDRSRLHTWDLQVRISQHLEPQRLREAIQRADLKLEPVTPTRAPELRSVAEAVHGRN